MAASNVDALVWYGVVQYGMVWDFGGVVFGGAWCGLLWCAMVRRVALSCVLVCSLVRSCALFVCVCVCLHVFLCVCLRLYAFVCVCPLMSFTAWGGTCFFSRKNLFHVETLQTKHVKLVSQERSKALAPAVHGSPSKQPDLIWARREDKIQQMRRLQQEKSGNRRTSGELQENIIDGALTVH